jgi:hypothetical protein
MITLSAILELAKYSAKHCIAKKFRQTHEKCNSLRTHQKNGLMVTFIG